MSHPPMQPSNSPNGRLGVAAPRRGESYGHADIFESFAESHMPPASSITTSAPASHNTLAAIPPAAPERGRALLVEQCGFCHGANARGGSGGPDLTRSVVVQEDEAGKQLGAFLRVGRPDRGMPKFALPEPQMVDLATFLHAAIYLN